MGIGNPFFEYPPLAARHSMLRRQRQEIKKSIMTSALPQVRLKIVRRSSHPWIFQKMVEKPAVRLPGGSVVDILDRDGQCVGRRFYNGHSRIALRVLTTNPDEAIDRDFFARRLCRAIP